jgi:hypothetical protein
LLDVLLAVQELQPEHRGVERDRGVEVGHRHADVVDGDQTRHRHRGG